MQKEYNMLREHERAALALRKLYARHGYAQYTMNRFEEYDLYARNKDFLVSEEVITFTDTNGRLLALKPDVTLSIIKNGRDGKGTEKVYYQENVYRVSPRTHSFAELMQVGLECIGDVDAYCLFEVLSLAAESLLTISPRAVLELSHLGILSALLDGLSVDADTRIALLKCIGDKNMHELRTLATAAGADGKYLEGLLAALALSGKPDRVLPRLAALLDGLVDKTLVADFSDTVLALAGTHVGHILRIDLSLTGDMRYYNGIVCKGFIEGLPTGILSGGQYDRLMKKMGRRDAAIGFAVYLDPLERLSGEERPLDADILVLYEKDAPLPALAEAVKGLTEQGLCVRALPAMPADMHYGKLLRFDTKEGTLREENA